MQGKGIDCLATHPGIADTCLYPKLDSKIEAKVFNAFETVHPPSKQCPDKYALAASSSFVLVRTAVRRVYAASLTPVH